MGLRHKPSIKFTFSGLLEFRPPELFSFFNYSCPFLPVELGNLGNGNNVVSWCLYIPSITPDFENYPQRSSIPDPRIEFCESPFLRTPKHRVLKKLQDAFRNIGVQEDGAGAGHRYVLSYQPSYV